MMLVCQSIGLKEFDLRLLPRARLTESLAVRATIFFPVELSIYSGFCCCIFLFVFLNYSYAYIMFLLQGVRWIEQSIAAIDSKTSIKLKSQSVTPELA